MIKHIFNAIGWIVLAFLFLVIIAMVYFAVGLKWTLLIIGFVLAMSALFILAAWLITR